MISHTLRMELLTNNWWGVACMIEDGLLQVRMAVTNLEPQPVTR
jgi:hypothetical protein